MLMAKRLLLAWVTVCTAGVVILSCTALYFAFTGGYRGSSRAEATCSSASLG